MRRILLVALSALALTITAKNVNEKKLNAQALKEYLQPIRPGYSGQNPFWNEFARKFTYAPAFDFQERSFARAYLFVITADDGRRWEMRSQSPKEALSPVWEQIPGGTQVTLDVFPIVGKAADTSDTLGHRTFLRDFPFRLPCNAPTRPYREAALKAMLCLHRLPMVQQWADHTEPDWSYRFSTYACKIIGATLRNECMVAHYFPSEREQALQIARNVATYLHGISQPVGAPLAYFPPTYTRGVLVNSSITKQEGEDATMCMEPLNVGQALLDLYRETNERQYYDWAIGIATTYKRLQRPDGSMPIKLVYSTGEPVNDRCAMLHPLLNYLQRLKDEFGVSDFEGVREAGERWMHDVAIRSFDMTGQFEDVSVLNLKPYQNLTNCTAAPYADYLWRKKSPSAADLEDARDLMRLSEDQFVFWDMRPEPDGIRKHIVPCVFEQYKYQESVDASACNVAGGFLSCYLCTGNQLALAKALALTNAITVAQDARSGFIPTIWRRSKKTANISDMWINCAVHSICHLLRTADAVGEP